MDRISVSDQTDGGFVAPLLLSVFFLQNFIVIFRFFQWSLGLPIESLGGHIGLEGPLVPAGLASTGRERTLGNAIFL